jgi:hypothetical protein
MPAGPLGVVGSAAVGDKFGDRGWDQPRCRVLAGGSDHELSLSACHSFGGDLELLERVAHRSLELVLPVRGAVNDP